MTNQELKPHTLYFHQLGARPHGDLSQIETALFNFLTEYSGRPYPTPNTIIMENRVQIQDIVQFTDETDETDKMGYPMFSGVVKKFINTDLPKKGVAGQSPEDEIKLKANESLIQRNYFLYHSHYNVLLYQYNRSGTPHNYFIKYLRTQDINHVLFDPIPISGAYEMLKQGDIELKKLNIRIPHSTITNLDNNSLQNPSPLVSNIIDLMTDIGGNLDLTLNAASKHETLNSPKASRFLRSLFKTLNKDPETKGLKGKIEFIDKDNTPHSIDLMMDKLSATINVLMDGSYPNPDDIVEKMKIAFDKKRDIFNGSDSVDDE